MDSRQREGGQATGLGQEEEGRCRKEFFVPGDVDAYVEKIFR